MAGTIYGSENLYRKGVVPAFSLLIKFGADEAVVLVQCSLPFVPGSFKYIFVTNLIVQMLTHMSTQQRVQRPEKDGCFLLKLTSVRSPGRALASGTYCTRVRVNFYSLLFILNTALAKRFKLCSKRPLPGCICSFR